MQKFIIALALVGIVDAISFMVVAPSISFYVIESGGTNEQFGIVLSAFSFSSFLIKPVLGSWSDRIGFRVPYFFSILLSCAGGVLYLIGGHFGPSSIAVLMILAGRVLGGVGAANAALGFAYLAHVVPHDEQTKINSMLSMMRILGMAAGPGFNVLLDKIDVTIYGFRLEPLNSVGLILIGSNLLAFLVVTFLLDEPKENVNQRHHYQHSSEIDQDDDDDEYEEYSVESVGVCRLLCASFNLDILVPILSIFSFNANFQMIEAALPLAANHALGWERTENSWVLGSMSILIFINMIIVYLLSSCKVKDENILTFGLLLSIAGYSLVWYLWVDGNGTWQFIIPIILSTSSFPYMAAPTRSIFTRAVDEIEALQDHQGIMQAILSMAASVAGFTAPFLVATYILETPEVVDASDSHRELTIEALYAPILSLVVLIGLTISRIDRHRRKSQVSNLPPPVIAPVAIPVAVPVPTEMTGLTRSAAQERRRSRGRYCRNTEANRRLSASMMGLSQTNLHHEVSIGNKSGSKGYLA